MTEWRIVPNSNVEVSNDGRVRRDGLEFIPYIDGKYRKINVNGKNVRLHRLIAIAFIPNPEAKLRVDHIDNNKINNCVENLRWATDHENARNRKPYNKASSLPRGVSMCKSRFHAYIRHNNKQYHLGAFDTPEEASLHYEAQAAMFHGEFYCSS